MEIDLKIPREGVRVLKKIQKIYPDAVISGGYLRDLYYGKKPKDIDIFIPFKENKIEETQEYKSLIAAIEVPLKKDEKDNQNQELEYTEGNMRDEVFLVTKFNNGEIECDIIHVKNNCDYVFDFFDFSINQIQFDGKKVIASDGFLNTAKTKVIKILNKDSEEREKLRKNRILEKFNDFKFED